MKYGNFKDNNQLNVFFLFKILGILLLDKILSKLSIELFCSIIKISVSEFFLY